MSKPILLFLFILLNISSFALRLDTAVFDNRQEQKLFTEYISGQKPRPLMFFCTEDFNNVSKIEKILTKNVNNLKNSGRKEIR
jgi:hypothetical protein